MDNAVKLIEAIAKLVSSFAWPLVALAVLWWFGTALRTFIGSISKGSIKAFGMEATAERITEALISADLTKVSADKKSSSAIQDTVGKSYRTAEMLAHRASIAPSLRGRRLLWVDDQPENNNFERQAFEALGIKVDTSINTTEAINRLQREDYAVVISDMSRAEGDREGYALLDAMKKAGLKVPVIIYTSTNKTDEARAVISAGAFASTSRPTDLLIGVADLLLPSDHPRGDRRFQEIRNLVAHRLPSY